MLQKPGWALAAMSQSPPGLHTSLTLGYGEVCIPAKWLIRPAHISPVSVPWFKGLRVILLTTGWDAGPLQGYTKHEIGRNPFTLYILRQGEAWEHNKMSPTSSWTQTAWSKGDCTNQEANVRYEVCVCVLYFIPRHLHFLFTSILTITTFPGGHFSVSKGSWVPLICMTSSFSLPPPH